MSEAAPALVCVGEPVNFNGSASFPLPGFTIDQYLWNFDDGPVDSTSGPIVDHAFPNDGEYVVQLTIIDNNDCGSLNLVDLHVQVSTTPDFSGMDPSVEVCFGETVSLYGHGEPVTWTALPDANFGDGIFLPDDVGQPFTSELLFEQFDPGQLVTSTTNIPSICVDMEHTYMGDLVLQVICPNGQTTLFHQQGGDNTYIGAPNDLDSDLDPILGECWHYCWSPTATNGTWIENTGNTTPAGTPANGSIDPGTYESVQPFSNLVGCPLNGTWTFQSSDLWGADNGFICGWEINFDPSIIPDLTEFTPSWGPEADSSSWSGGTVPNELSANGDTLSFTATAPGAYPFIYSVTDNFGCTYDTTITVTVDEPFQVDAGPDVVVCNAAVQLNATIFGAPTSCDWMLELNDSWGDGWNGSQMTVNVNGTSTAYTIPTGTQFLVNLPLNAGDVLTFTYSPGGYENEVDFILYDDVGNVIFSDGPFPQTGLVWSGSATCGGAPGMVWSWSPTTGLSDATIADPTVDVTSPTTYTATAHLIGHPLCVASDAVAVVFDPAADPGLDSLLVICPAEPLFQMIDMLGGTPTNGGVWTDASGAVITGTFDPATDNAGTFTYTVTSLLGCVGTAQLEVQVLSTNDPLCCGTVNPGTDGSLTVCSSGVAEDLFAQIGGTPDSGGSWADPSGTATTGTFTPGVDGAGGYVYSVGGNGACPAATAIVTVTVLTEPDPGTDGSMIACGSDAALDLFGQLGGTPDPAGTWTDLTGMAHGASFDPGSDAAGSYTYTVAATAPCPSAQAMVEVTLAVPPNAGTDGSLTACSASPAMDLFAALGGAPVAGGTWTDGNNAAHTGLFDPATDAAGVYTYTLVGAAPCPDASAIVTVVLAANVNAGTDASVSACSNGAMLDLFSILGGTPDAGGTWTDVNSAAGTGLFDPATDAAGAFTYTVGGVAPCPNASAIVTVDVLMFVDAGTDGSVTECSSAAVLDLFSFLGGTPDAAGTWTDPAGSVHAAIFDPATDTGGPYTYTVAGIAPCPSAQAMVDVALVPAPDAGTNGAPIFCEASPSIDLLPQLSGAPDTGGTWTFGGAPHGSSFDPDMDLSGLYTYTVDGDLPCPAASANVMVDLAPLPDPGTDGTLLLCISSGATDLFTALGGTPEAGGTWTDANNATHSSLFDPATDALGTFTYTVAGTTPCSSASATVTVDVLTNPDAGTGGAITLCTNSVPTDLFAQLGGTPDAGGVWMGPGGASSAQFDPATMSAGPYVYTLTVPPPCVSASSTVDVALVALPDPGLDAAFTLCVTSAAIDLYDQLEGAPDAGGAWTDPGGAFHAALFDPVIDPAGAYTYTVAGTAPCPNASATVTLTLQTPPTAGADASLELCTGSPAVELQQQLSGADPGGTWTDPQGQLFIGLFQPATSASGAYTYTVAGAVPCPADAATVTIAVASPPDAGEDGSLALCDNGPALSLAQALGGTPDAGGLWTGPNGAAITGSFDPATDPAGTFTYTVDAPAPCVSDIAQVTISIAQLPDPGSDGALTLCPSGASANLFAALNGTPEGGGAWTAPGGTICTSTFDPVNDAPGSYTYTINAVAPCPDQQAQVLVAISTPMSVTVTRTDAICHGACDGTAVLLVSGGTPGYAFAWPTGVAATDSLATGFCAGPFVVPISDAAGCASAAQFSIAEPPPLVINGVDPVDETCVGACDGTLTVIDPQGVQYSTDLGLNWQPSPVVADLCAGAYTLMMQDADGCTAISAAAVQGPAPVIAEFSSSPGPITVENPVVQFQNQSIQATQFAWDFAGNSTSTAIHPAAAFPDVLGGEYLVCLVATNEVGCTDEVCHPIVIHDLLTVHAPNAFTPNADGLNEGFAPVFNMPASAQDYEFLIFDRWGERIFESHTVNEPWTGHFGGTMAKEDVYVWKLTARDAITAKRIERTGTITLLK